MSRRAPCVSRADLLRLMDVEGVIEARAAEVCGYGVEPLAITTDKDGIEPEKAAGRAADEGVPSTPSRSTKKVPPWPFFRVLEFQAKGPIPVNRSSEGPAALTNDNLRVRYHRPGVPFVPLVAWPRLVSFLRHALGRNVPTQRIHDRRLGRLLSRGLPLVSLPRMARRTWAPQAVLLYDRAWREMAPFQDDAAYVVDRLRKEMGKAGVRIIEVNGPPPLRQLSKLAPGVPVLALSTLGQYEGNRHTLAAWAAAAELLVARGHPVAALTPCPRWHWREKICSSWPLTVWDGRVRASRKISWQHPLGRCEKATAVTGRLMDLLAPAALVERSLLRAARLKLGSPADVGCEWEAWFDAHGWSSSDSFGLVRPEESASADQQAARLEKRTGDPLAREIDSLILIQHGQYHLLLELEARMRAFFYSEGNDEDEKEVVDLLERAVERLRKMDAEIREDVRSNLAPSFVEMVERITPFLRSHTRLAELVAEGLGHAHRFMKSEEIQWGEGVRMDTALRSFHADAVTDETVRQYQLGLLPTHHGKEIGLSPLPVGRLNGQVPFAILSTPGRHSLLSILEGRVSATLDIPVLVGGICSANLAQIYPGEIRIESNLETLECTRLARPAWARRMWYDRYGLAAEFRVEGVPFVLRWIPPGRFLMGSPEDEPGRWDVEGPQHERVIEKGFWLGETVVTQAQWRAVMGQNPSHFKGPETLPVEQVSWQDCGKYLAKLKALVPGLAFRLPEEAEWEYACRAGTDTALWTGGITIHKDYDAPELEDIAWYVGNSWKDLEVENPRDMKPYDWKHPDGNEAGTHVVKGKDANPWGLYDMLGNVWEWCEDAWGEKAYEKQLDGGNAPDAGESAVRVVRGGSWSFLAGHCRSACRGRFGPVSRWFNLGFRLAAGQEQEAAKPLGSGATVPKS